MSQWREVLRIDADIDLAPLKRYMADNDCPIHIFEQHGQQVVCALDHCSEEQVNTLFDAWRDGRVDRSQYSQPLRQLQPDMDGGALSRWRDYPLTMLLIALAYIVFIGMYASEHIETQLLALLVFQPVVERAGDFYLLSQWPELDQVWRYVTPAMLHFSFVHILFNSLMLLEVGRRIETQQGAGRLLLLVLACAVISNAGQFYASPAVIFGGLSGAVFGLIGYCWLFDKLSGRAVLGLPGGVFVSALIWLVLCFSPLPEWAGLGKVANAAHIWGLVAGLLGAVLGVLLSVRR